MLAARSAKLRDGDRDQDRRRPREARRHGGSGRRERRARRSRGGRGHSRAAARRARISQPIPLLPDDTRLWAALQDASGGTWGGCVFDVDAILKALAAGRRALEGSMKDDEASTDGLVDVGKCLPDDHARPSSSAASGAPRPCGPDARSRAGRQSRRLRRASPPRRVSSSTSTIRSRRFAAQVRCRKVAPLDRRAGELGGGGRETTARRGCSRRATSRPIKASGVTFVASLLERVIEEQARGDAGEGRRACARRSRRSSARTCSRFGPGSDEARRLKDVLDRAGRLVAVPRGRHRPGRRDFLEGPADVRRRHRRRSRHPSEVGVEQPRARNRARRQPHRPRRRRDARQRRQPSRLRRPQRPAAGQGEGQQRLVRDRPLHPALRRALHDGRRAAVRSRAAHAGSRRLCVYRP